MFLGGIVHPESFQDFIVLVDLEGLAEVEADVITLRGHFDLHDRLRVGVDNQERQWDLLFPDRSYFAFAVLVVIVIATIDLRSRRGWSLTVFFDCSCVVPPQQILEADILRHQLLQAFPLFANVVLSLGPLLLQLLHALASAQSIPIRALFTTLIICCFASTSIIAPTARQSAPRNLLLILGDDIHGHEDVESVVDSAADVLVVVILLRGLAVGRLSLPLLGGFLSPGRRSFLDGLLG